MDTSKIINLIKERCTENNVYILRGFPNEILKCLGRDLMDYEYLDINGLIDLTKINPMQIFQKIMNAPSKPSFMLMESIISLTSMIRSLSVLGKRFVILNNNFLTRYKNPTNCDIPDFESPDFQNSTNNHEYSLYYAYCEHKDGEQLVNYVEPNILDESCVSNLSLLQPSELCDIQEVPEELDAPILAGDNDSLQVLLEKLFYGNYEEGGNYTLPKNSRYTELQGILLSAIKLFNLNTKLYWLTNPKQTIVVRPELQVTMSNVWGYDSFRKLKMYKDLDFCRDVVSVSQGEIIETVVEESEKAQKNQPYRNILLTSPTGAGKSLLFQLAAIYLANKYNSLTIVISPLVALMEDQVLNLKSKYEAVATLNGNKTAAESAEIKQKVLEGKINILYVAPELLLAHSISSLIGERTLGLLVIDEAHTVTTWGRDFRVDYWFLGDYLRTSRKYLSNSFPIFALTATAVWDPSRKNDMVFETINSLNMDPCIKFIGVVRRDNIVFEVGRPKQAHDYEHQRLQRTSTSIIGALNADRKTIVYFPYIRTIKQVLNYPDIQPYRLKITEYHSKLMPIEKVTNANNFRNGICPVICASKAYGMGVDVPDITEVYHHAPTGTLSDYVQEIGRLARDEQLVGIAKIDFNEQDFKYTRQLHGLSTIKPYQLEQVLKKLLDIYRIRGEKRNMMISPSDFEYIFPGTSDLDQKFKSSLLLISHDLMRRLQFPALIVRPKNLFVNVFVQVDPSEVKNFYKQYMSYLEPIDMVNGRFILKGEKYWNEHMSSFSFPQFKNKLASNQVFRGYHVHMINRIEITLNEKEVNIVKDKFRMFFKKSQQILSNLANTIPGKPRHIKYCELKESLDGYAQMEKEEFLQAFILTYTSSLNGQIPFCQVKIKENEDNNQISLISHGYEVIGSQMMRCFEQYVVDTESRLYCNPTDPEVRMAEILNSLGLATFQRQGGSDPQVFIRINNPTYLHDLITGGNYKNQMLIDIYKKYKFSERIFTYFFNTDMTNNQRWDFIEEYFLGASEDKLLHFVD